MPIRFACATLLLLAAMLSLSVRAEPVPVEAAPALQSSLPYAPIEGLVDVQHWVRDEGLRALPSVEIDIDRRDLLRQGWQARPPTWIQGSTTVNLGDYPTLDDAVERAERELQTLEWVIEDQRRQASAETSRRNEDAESSAEDDRWFRHLLPRAWIGVLKENREWVAGGGTALLIFVWGASIFARRPGAVPPPADVPASCSGRRRRRRRHPRSLQPQ